MRGFVILSLLTPNIHAAYILHILSLVSMKRNAKPKFAQRTLSLIPILDNTLLNSTRLKFVVSTNLKYFGFTKYLMYTIFLFLNAYYDWNVPSSWVRTVMG